MRSGWQDGKIIIRSPINAYALIFVFLGFSSLSETSKLDDSVGKFISILFAILFSLTGYGILFRKLWSVYLCMVAAALMAIAVSTAVTYDFIEGRAASAMDAVLPMIVITGMFVVPAIYLWLKRAEFGSGADEQCGS